MLSFKKHTEELSENRNTHLTHIEEAIITDGSSGAENAINFSKKFVTCYQVVFALV